MARKRGKDTMPPNAEEDDQELPPIDDDDPTRPWRKFRDLPSPDYDPNERFTVRLVDLHIDNSEAYGEPINLIKAAEEQTKMRIEAAAAAKAAAEAKDKPKD